MAIVADVITMGLWMMQINLVPAHWTEHWGHFDQLASTWLHDIDHKVGDKMGQLLGAVPSLRTGLSPPMELSSMSPETKPRVDEVECPDLILSLQKERAAKKRMQKRFWMARLRTRRVKDELERFKLHVQATELNSNGSSELLDKIPPAILQASGAAILALLSAMCVLRCKGRKPERDDLQKQLYDKSSELLEKITAMSVADEEMDADTVQAGDTDICDSLDTDFSFCIFDSQVGQERARYIKIKCPGVQPSDVVVDVVGNGCVVTIERKPSQGVDAAEWVRRFIFPVSDGLFNLRDDQVTLDGGFLTLAFRAFRSRVFRFPQRFDMSAGDDEGSAWLQCDDCSAADRAESTILRASQALRVAAVADSHRVLWTARTVSSAASSSCGTSDDFDKLPDVGAEK